MDNKPIEEGARSFSTMLAGLEHGQLMVDLTSELHVLNKALRERAVATHTSVTGELALRIRVRLDPLGVAQIEADFGAKTPKTPRPQSIMWLSPGGNLVGENPRQQKLPLREVPAPDPVRDVAQAPTEVRGA